MVDINLRGVILGCKLAANRFTKRGGGTIINIASMAGIAGFPGVATYCATKFGVVGLTSALREELRPHGITVCAILPGVVHTELSAGIQLPAGVENFVSVEPDDIAAAVARVARTHHAMSYVPAPAAILVAHRAGDAGAPAPIPGPNHPHRAGLPRRRPSHPDAYHSRAGAGS